MINKLIEPLSMIKYFMLEIMMYTSKANRNVKRDGYMIEWYDLSQLLSFIFFYNVVKIFTGSET